MLLFNDEDDPKCIFMQGPWSFDKYCEFLDLCKLDCLS